MSANKLRVKQEMITFFPESNGEVGILKKEKEILVEIHSPFPGLLQTGPPENSTATIKTIHLVRSLRGRRHFSSFDIIRLIQGRNFKAARKYPSSTRLQYFSGQTRTPVIQKSQRLSQSFQKIACQESIRIKKYDEFAARDAYPLVPGEGTPHVFSISDKFNLRITLRNEIRRRVRGAIINHAYFHIRVLLRQYRINAGLDKSPAIKRGDHKGQ